MLHNNSSIQKWGVMIDGTVVEYFQKTEIHKTLELQVLNKCFNLFHAQGLQLWSNENKNAGRCWKTEKQGQIVTGRKTCLSCT